MSRLQHLPVSLKKSIAENSLLKVIAGLSNFDRVSVKRVATAAVRGGADLLDIACDHELVAFVRKNHDIPICVSAVNPDLFPDAVKAGASMIEIGNFDSLYLQGRVFEADEVLSLTRETRKLLPEVIMSVTVPHKLPLDKQSQLALDLVDEGADFIQTEGGVVANPKSIGNLGLIEKAAPSLAAAYSIKQTFDQANVSIPIMCSSGLSTVTIPMALSVGASGVGVGSVVNKLSTEIEMIAMVKSLREATIRNNVRIKV